MSEEKLNKILEMLSKVRKEIESIPGSTGNGQLIDALNHANSAGEHLKRYYALIGESYE